VKKCFEWSPQARSDLKEIEREQAIQILMALTRYGETGKAMANTSAESWLAHAAFAWAIGGSGFRKRKRTSTSWQSVTGAKPTDKI
jgi:hypothetical protein